MTVWVWKISRYSGGERLLVCVWVWKEVVSVLVLDTVFYVLHRSTRFRFSGM